MGENSKEYLNILIERLQNVADSQIEAIDKAAGKGEPVIAPDGLVAKVIAVEQLAEGVLVQLLEMVGFPERIVGKFPVEPLGNRCRARTDHFLEAPIGDFWSQVTEHRVDVDGSIALGMHE